MPDFEFTSPEGKKYTVTGPEGATQEQAWGILQQQLGGGTAKPKTESGGFWNSAADFFKSIPQAATRAIAQRVSEAGQYEERMGTGGGYNRPQTLSGLITGQPASGFTVPSAEQYAERMGANQMYQPQGMAGRFSSGVTQSALDPKSWMAPGGIVGKTLSLLGSEAGSEAAGAMFPKSTAAPIIGGIVGGMTPSLKGAGRGVAEATARTDPLKGDPVRRQMVGTLRQEGIEPTAGEALDSKGIREFERFGSLPGGGTSYRDLKAKVGDQLTQAVAGKIGENATELSPLLWQRSEAKISQMYKNSVDRIGVTFERDVPELGGGVKNSMRDVVHDLRTQALSELSDEQFAKVNKLLDRLLPDQVIKAGPSLATMPSTGLWVKDKTGLWRMSGAGYQRLTNTKSALSDMLNSEGSIKHFGREIDKLLNSWVEKSARGPLQKQALATFQEANRRYWIRKVALNAVDDRTAKQGHIDPERLASALKDEEGLQAGTTDLHRLANAARAILEPYSPLGFGGGHESGGRGAAASLGRMGTFATIGAATGGLSGGVPGAAVGSAIGAMTPGWIARKINSPGVQAYLKGRPDYRAYLQRKGLLTTPAEKVTTAVRHTLAGGSIGARDRKEKRPQLYE